ncbi:MAG: GtrA family protein [Pseudonocardiales bacterium]|nr:GtrA family protein [Pseudonocardiales bacterium]
MASATFALTGRAFEMPAQWRARVRLQYPTLAQLARYAIVGGAGTSLNVVLFLVARPWLDAVPANVVAIVVSTVATTEANRRFTFGAEGGHRWRTLLQNVCTVAFYAFYGSAVLMLLNALVERPTELMESAAVVSASLLGGLARFSVMRLWEFAPSDAHAHSDRSAADRSERSSPRRSTEPRSVTTTSTS